MDSFAQRPSHIIRRRWFSLAAISGSVLIALTACSAGESSVTAPNANDEVMTTAQPFTESCSGVEVFVDFGILSDEVIDVCVDVSAKTPAVSVLDSAGISVAGTEEYGNAVLCRVNGMPAAETPIVVSGHDPYNETCVSMPPEFAYWDVWLKQGGRDWEYAMVGKSEIMVSPGDAIGLVFNTGTSTPAPQ
jgi:hypothetical protein